MDYKKMIEEAKKKGLTNDAKMWSSISLIGEGFDALKESHPEMYWKMMRKQHDILYGGHYSDEFAYYDVDQMHSTDRNGSKHHGAHWTKEEVINATSGKAFPAGVTDCDKYVAYNAFWHDLNKKCDDAQILELAYLFFFDDEDYEQPTKIWDYMEMVSEHN